MTDNVPKILLTNRLAVLVEEDGAVRVLEAVHLLKHAFTSLFWSYPN